MAGRRGWGRAAGVAAASVVVAVLAVGGLAGLPPGVWDSWTPASCLPDACFCEAVGAGPVRQPINAWSSLAFVPVGLWAAFGAGRGSGGYGPAHRTAWGVGLVLVGLGSAFYHASLTYLGQFFDVLGMHIVALAMLGFAVERWRRTWLVGTWRVAAPALLATSALLWWLPATRRWLFAALLVVALGVEALVARRDRSSTGWLMAGTAGFAVAFAVWVADHEGVWCSPSSPLQGHAVWHVLGAASAVALVRHDVSLASPRSG